MGKNTIKIFSAESPFFNPTAGHTHGRNQELKDTRVPKCLHTKILNDRLLQRK